MGFLQNARARVFLPTEVEVAVSEDGQTFWSLGALTHDVPWDDYTPGRRYFETRAEPGDGDEPPAVRFVRVRATNRGITPAGHDRAGEPAWLYVDEIIVR